MLNPDQAEFIGQSIAPPHWCAISLWDTPAGRVVVGEPGVPGRNAPYGSPGSSASSLAPALGDGAQGPRMKTKGVTDQETHLEKWKLLFSIEPVGDTQLIGISGFL